MQRIHRSGELIYYDVPKVASSSIKTALGISAIGYAYGEVPPTPDQLEGFKFSFVRHPIQRLLSAYNMYYPLADYYHLPENFADFIETALFYETNVHWLPQWYFLPVVGNKIELDFLGRFETLAQDWAKLQQQFNLPNLPKINASEPHAIKVPEVYFDLVVERYTRDFELLGYDPRDTMKFSA